MFNLNPNFLSPALKCICAFVLILIIILVVKSCNEKLRSPVQDAITIQAPEVKHYVDDSGKQHAEVAAIATPAANMLDSHYQHIIDSLSKMLKSKPKDIEAIVDIGTNTTGNFKPVITTTDTSQNFNNTSVDYHDKYLKLHGNLNKDSSWSYSIHDSLTIVTYLKRKGWFGHQLYLDATAMNPNTSIKGITGIEISGYKPHKWGIGVNVGYGFNGVAFSPIVSVGLQRNFIRF